MTCDEPATYVIFWPGRPPAYVCAFHAEGMVRVADAGGWAIHPTPAVTTFLCPQIINRNAVKP